MINELKLIDNFDILFNNKIILYGAGQKGIEILKQLKGTGVHISYFCDSDSEKHGNIISGVEVISPQKLRKIDKNETIVIIITSVRLDFIEQIINMIKRMYFNTGYVFTAFGFEIAILKNINNPRINDDFRNNFILSNALKKAISIYSTKNSDAQACLSCIGNNKSVLVYQSSKVGSSSVTESLFKVGIPNLHIHYVNGHFGDYVDEIGDFIKIYKKNKPVKIITLVREPLSRDFSSFTFLLYAKRIITCPSYNDSFIDNCVLWMNEIALNFPWGCKYGFQFDWFDNEFKAVFGIDIFEHPFDKEKGYSIVKQDNVEVLVMKLEKLNSLESIIGKFVGVPHFKLINANEGNNMLYKYLYQNIKDTIKLPRKLVDLYYKGNPRMDHFYTEEEKETFLKKWKKNIYG
jgi:hypothetical protein